MGQGTNGGPNLSYSPAPGDPATTAYGVDAPQPDLSWLADPKNMQALGGLMQQFGGLSTQFNKLTPDAQSQMMQALHSLMPGSQNRTVLPPRQLPSGVDASDAAAVLRALGIDISGGTERGGGHIGVNVPILQAPPRVPPIEEGP